MATGNGNKTLLIVIALLLAGILGILALQATKKTPEEKVADSVSEAVESIGNTISGTKD